MELFLTIRLLCLRIRLHVVKGVKGNISNFKSPSSCSVQVSGLSATNIVSCVFVSPLPPLISCFKKEDAVTEVSAHICFIKRPLENKI